MADRARAGVRPHRRGGPRVAVVGAGLDGLVAADRLARAGVDVALFEAAERPGGRVRTARAALAPGLTTELGGEFIDSDHMAIRALAAELGLDLLDLPAQVPPDLGRRDVIRLRRPVPDR